MHPQQFPGFVYRSYILRCSSLLGFTLSRPKSLSTISWQVVAPNVPITEYRFCFRSLLWKTSAIPAACQRFPLGSRSRLTWNIIKKFSVGVESPTHNEAKTSGDINDEKEDTVEADLGSIAVGGIYLVQRMPEPTEYYEYSAKINRLVLHRAVDMLQASVRLLHGRDRNSARKSLRMSIEVIKLQTTLEELRSELSFTVCELEKVLSGESLSFDVPDRPTPVQRFRRFLTGVCEIEKKREEYTRDRLSQFCRAFGPYWEEYTDLMHLYANFLAGLEGSKASAELMQGAIGCTVRRLSDEIQHYTELQKSAIRRLNESGSDVTEFRRKAEQIDVELRSFINESASSL